MTNGRSPLRGLICEDDPSISFAVRVIMERHGIEVVGVPQTAADTISMARATRPGHVVVDLALSGVLGLRLVGELHDAAPGCGVVVLSSFPALHRPARRAGATDVFDFSDLRRLDRALERQGAHEPGCACCPIPGTEIGRRPPSPSTWVDITGPDGTGQHGSN